MRKMNRTSDGLKDRGIPRHVGWFVVVGLAGAVALLVSGCASPGHPLPPSLEIPRQTTDLTVERVGDEVRLHWTTPGRTTDGAQLQATALVAQICRRVGTPTVPPPVAAQRQSKVPGSCNVVVEVTVRPGSSGTVDHLTGALVQGPPVLLAYEVQLLGPTRKTAGPSGVVYTLAGTGPRALADFQATNTADGVLLRWTRETAAGQESVRLERTTAKSATNAVQSGSAAVASNADGGGAVTNLSAGEGDTGGVVDRSAAMGQAYTYTAQRMMTATVDGQAVTVRGPVAGPVTVTIQDVFPPSAPAGLVGSPGPGSIDLSWEPVEERANGERLVGYKVYRAAEGAASWTLLTAQPVTVPAYRDEAVQTGVSYRYRVTAVDAAGKESEPSKEETVVAVE